MYVYEDRQNFYRRKGANICAELCGCWSTCLVCTRGYFSLEKFSVKAAAFVMKWTAQQSFQCETQGWPIIARFSLYMWSIAYGFIGIQITECYNSPRRVSRIEGSMLKDMVLLYHLAFWGRYVLRR